MKRLHVTRGDPKRQAPISSALRPRLQFAMSKYQYTPLPRDHSEIRLVRLQPGRFGDEIENEDHSWGAPDRTDKAIVIHSRDQQSIEGRSCKELQDSRIQERDTNVTSVLQITKNLAEALRHLKDQDRSKLIWIDAICINQDDLEERSAEVSEMGSIYRNAQEVIVWLGPGSHNSKLAVATLNRIGRSVELDRGTHTVSTTSGSWPASLEDSPEALNSNKNRWLAVRDLLNREWFSRLWVFQEIVLAQNARVVVGYDTIDWEPFVGALALVDSMSATFEKYFYSLRLPRKDTFLRVIEGCESEISVWRALDYSQRLDCSDPRDKLYGIRSILKKSISELIVPDYSQSLERVFINFAKKWLAKANHLNILDFCNVPLDLRTPNLPSWVPDLSRAPTTKSFPITGCSGYSCAFASVNDQDHLICQGILIGKITFVTSPAEHTAENATERCEAWLEIVKSSQNQNQNLEGESMSEASFSFLEMIVGGNVRERFPNEKSWHPTTADISAFLAGRKLEGENVIEGYIRQSIGGRSLFETSEGVFSLCPEGAKPGDSVAVMLGYDTPVVLRPVDDPSGKHFQFVGACYMPSYMDAEALLGPFPSDWSAKVYDIVDDDNAVMYTNGNIITQQDPRMELPPDWRYMYGNPDAPQSVESRELADMMHQWFENVKTGEQTWVDPRLTPELLKERGVAIREFVIV